MRPKAHKPAVGQSPDLARILALPRRPPVEPGSATAQALIEHALAKYGRQGVVDCRCRQIQLAAGVAEARVKPCVKIPNYAQAWALHELAVVGGLVAQLPVGSGKTLLSILGAIALPGCRTCVLLVPSTLVGQLVLEYDLVAEHFRVPSLVVHAGADSPRPRFVRDAPATHVIPYSRISRAEATVFLETMRPDLIIADEWQNLASVSKAQPSTRASRFLRYFARHGQGTHLLAMSGTLTDDELQDFGPACTLSLREGSPLPNDPEVLDEWGLAVNPSEWVAPAGELEVLCQPGEHVQDGLHRRLVETPGFVVTSGSAVNTELEITERQAPPIPAAVAEALAGLRALWFRPDGEKLVEALSVARCARELACGLYLRWRFVKGETEEQVYEWLEARREWRSEMCDKLRRREPHLDSPLLCANAAMRSWGRRDPGPVDVDEEGRGLKAIPEDHQLPEWRAHSWPRWAAIKGLVHPITEAVRIDDFLARDAAAWATSNLGIVWYATVAFGTWVAEISGLPMHGGGRDAGERLAREDGTRSIICSIASHGTGRDGLQRLFATQLVGQSPSSAWSFEQLFGRLVRIGQESGVVKAQIYRHTPETRDAVDSAMRKAGYVSRTMGSRQMLRAGWRIPLRPPDQCLP